MPDISDSLAVILRENFDVVVEHITPQVTLDDLGVDSVATIELVDILQAEFGIKIADDELTDKSTVEQVVGAVSAKVGA